MQLQERLQGFQAAGIGVVALTYDSPELQRRFVEKYSIGYPVLSDVNAESMTQLGILNEEYAPGDDNYGIPHPGIFVIDRQGRIVGKIFVQGYEKRVDADSVLAYAQSKLP